jgi:hypothetical protein
MQNNAMKYNIIQIQKTKKQKTKNKTKNKNRNEIENQSIYSLSFIKVKIGVE